MPGRFGRSGQSVGLNSLLILTAGGVNRHHMADVISQRVPGHYLSGHGRHNHHEHVRRTHPVRKDCEHQEEAVTSDTITEPVHPGEILLQEFLKRWA
jgi:hypothetical protein